MEILLLNGADEQDEFAEVVCRCFEEISEEMGHEVTPMVLRNMEMADCPGDYECFIKTPGLCTLAEDDGHRLLQQWTKSHLVIAVTPVHYGGFSAHLNRATDRHLSGIVPHLEKRNGEVHFKIRYDRLPSLVFVGLAAEDDEEKEAVFRRLVKENASMFEPPAWAMGIIKETMAREGIADEVARLLQKVGAHQ